MGAMVRFNAYAKPRTAVAFNWRLCMRRGFTLVELIVVIVVLAILSGAAIVRYYDHAGKAKDAADAGALGGINEALNHKHLANRMADAPQSAWVTLPAHVAPALEFDALPFGIVIQNGEFVDQRGNRYQLIPETATSPARIALASTGAGGGGGPGAPGSGGAGGGAGAGGGGGGTTGGAAAIPPQAIPVILGALLLGRPRREGGAA
jgi:prepilin-type N-terminal cleavage/methylation domain-containing protein